MAYDPENNPYVPGDPASYDLKWIVEQLNGTIDANEAAIQAQASADAAANSASSALNSANNAAASATLLSDLFVTPEMFGAVGDGITDDSTALNNMFSAAVNDEKPVFFSSKTYYITAQINITGLVSVEGNGAVIKVSPGVNGLIMTGYGPESIFRNLIITSENSQFPTDGTIGLSVSGAHSKLNNISINNFEIGILYDETLSAYNQTGVVFENIHVRYCGIAFLIGQENNGKTTDYYFSDITACANNIGIEIGDAIGYIFNNLHIWGSPTYGIKLSNTSLTNINNIYIEECISAHIVAAIRKGLNISNISVISASAPALIEANGLTDDFHLNVNNLAIRSDGMNVPTIFKTSRIARINVSNIYDSETSLPYNGYNLHTGSAAKIFVDGIEYFEKSFFADLRGQNINTGMKAVSLAPNTDGSIAFDLQSVAAGSCMLLEISSASRSFGNLVQAGKHELAIYRSASGLIISAIQDILNNLDYTLATNISGTTITITITHQTNTYLTLIAEPKQGIAY